MALSQIMYDLILAPYRIGQLQKNRKAFYLLMCAQIPYFILPGIFLLVGILGYFMLVQIGAMLVSFMDLLINSKKYKYSEGKEYSEEYLMIQSPLTEL
jgi:hypothetical protein